jgi:polar amino acid transport system substrate-binding protein
MRNPRNWLILTVSLLCTGAIAACGSSSSSSSSTTTTPATTTTTSAAIPQVEALVPAPVKSKGTLTVAADASYAPDEFFAPDGKTVIGMDADLAKALGAVMGLKVKVVNATFATIIPGLASGRYDMGASSFTDTKAREKTVDMVDYANVGESFYTKSNGGTSIGSISDICGKTVSAVKVLVFSTQTEANLAVSSGRAQLGFADTPVALYQVKQSGGGFKLVGAAFAPAPYGLAVPKNGLDKAVLGALIALKREGTYAKIFGHWGLAGIEIPESGMKINGATS